MEEDVKDTEVKGDGRVSPPPPSAPADWYPDPENDQQQRYWDGDEWTVNVAPRPATEAAAEAREAESASQASPVDDKAAETAAAPGWYVDPHEAPLRRYWDGAEWTEWTDDNYDEPGPRSRVGRTDPNNDSLVTIGWITAILFPLIGVVVGVMLAGRNDERGTHIVIASFVAIVIWTALWVALAAAGSGA